MNKQQQYDRDYAIVQEIRGQKIRVLRNEEQQYEDDWEITWLNSKNDQVMLVRNTSVKSGLKIFKWVPLPLFFSWQVNDAVAKIIENKMQANDTLQEVVAPSSSKESQYPDEDTPVASHLQSPDSNQAPEYKKPFSRSGIRLSTQDSSPENPISENPTPESHAQDIKTETLADLRSTLEPVVLIND